MAAAAGRRRGPAGARSEEADAGGPRSPARAGRDEGTTADSPTRRPKEEDHATHYGGAWPERSRGHIHGNVKHLVQSLSRLSGNIPQLGLDGGSCSGCVNHRFKHLRYQYDLISGNVLQVSYQSGDDGMRHRYFYDADNRLTEVRTSADGQVWYTDAEYFYYPHGPLRRVELGQPKVQGMDYAYTLQGWLKGINSDLLEPKNDMGQDGVAGTANASVGRDAYGMSIGYYGDDDYSAIDDGRWDNQYGTKPFAAVGGAGTLAAAHNPLYNGNIAHTVNSLQPWGGWTAPSQPAQVLAQVYRYDQLNRLKQAQGVEGLTVATNSWESVTDAVADRYKSAYTYDANGNIKTAERHDENGLQYDDFAYQYHTAGGQLLQNRLYDLYDAATHTTGADIVAPAGTFDNSSTGVNQNNNYSYDELGNLIADKREEIGNIHWTVAGKVKRITRTPGSTKPELVFAYGADGKRISKTVGDPLNGGYKEYYIRDAQGNVMAIYRYQLELVPNTNPQEYTSSLMLTERPMYGSSRIGSHTQEMEMIGSTPPQYYPYTQPMPAPKKRYELTDHLGNVSTVVTGKLLPMAGGGYQAEVVSAQSYEPFGSLLPGRNYQSSSYNFGFNGKLKDDEIHGATGTSYDFGARLYDPRVGRWLSLDPLVRKYPAWSPYAFTFCNPIFFKDENGKEGVAVIDHQNATVIIKAVYFVDVSKAGFSKDDLNQLRGINSTLNAKGYTVDNENSGANGYCIQFDLQFVPVNSGAKASQFAVSEKELTEGNATAGVSIVDQGFPIANSMVVTDNATFDEIPSIKETAARFGVSAERVLGITDESHQHINIPYRSKGVILTAIHEIFHTLEYNNDGADSGIASGTELPTNDEVNSALKGLEGKGRVVDKEK